jgi:hypothetical protein
MFPADIFYHFVLTKQNELIHKAKTPLAAV